MSIRFLTVVLIGILSSILLTCVASEKQAKQLPPHKSATEKVQKVVTLDARPGIKQKFILITPKNPVAVVILFAGGHGNLKLSSYFGTPSIGWGKMNFLVRTRDKFAENGFLVAVVDAPSDKKSEKGMLGGFRSSLKHVEDIDHVIKYLRRKVDVPVWLIGTSRGTESAAYIAINSKEHPDGLVLSSSMSKPNRRGTPVTNMELDKINIPTLVVAHTDDGCSTTPPEGAEQIIDLLSNSKKKELKMFRGGDYPKSKPCQAMSYHGFLGIEDQVVNYISNFIKANLSN